MNGGHQALFDAEGVVQDLGHGSQTVGGAGGVGNEVHALVIGCVVHAHDEHGGVILRGGGQQDFFGPAVQVALHLFCGGKLAGALDDILRADRAPGDLARLLTVEHADAAAVDDQVVTLPAHLALEPAVYAVVLQQIRHVVRGLAVAVDADELNVRPFAPQPKHQAANSAESVNAYFHTHCRLNPFRIIILIFARQGDYIIPHLSPR